VKSNKLFSILLGFIVGVLACLVLTKYKSGNNQKPGLATTRQLLDLKPLGKNEVESDATLARDTNQKLFYSTVVAHAATSTALLRKIDQEDFKTVKGVLKTLLKGDLEICAYETNYPFSSQEKQALANAKEYLQRNETNK
jgi:hypothetical protein